MTPQVVVIGAGVIGITTALELQRRGHSVLVLDRDGIAAQTSAGNAGAFAFSEVEPLATPGIMRKAPKWLLDPLGPLSIPAYLCPEDRAMDVSVLAGQSSGTVSKPSECSGQSDGPIRCRADPSDCRSRR